MPPNQMAHIPDYFRLLDPAASDRSQSQSRRTTRRLRFLAIGVGATAALLSVVVGIYSYRASYQMQLQALLRTNVAMAEALADHALAAPDSSEDTDPLDRILAAWAKMPREDPAMFACVVANDGKLLLNSQRPNDVGLNVSGIVLPASGKRSATSIGELLAKQADWDGLNRTTTGVPQLAAFKYSPDLHALIVIHTPESSYAAKVHQATFPWLIGFAASTLLMWPLGLLLMNLAYGRARKQGDIAERERQATEQLFEQIFEQAAVGVALIHTESGRFARINGKYESLIGYKNAEIKLKTWQQVTHPDDLAEDVERMELLKAGRLREFELQKRLIRRDGGIMWVNLTVSPTWTQGENGTYHIAIIEDITERKRAEEKFRRQQSELAHVSRLSVMGEMVAGIAHEINQPLFAITNFAHTCGRVLALENLSRPDVLEWCLDIEREATRAAEIIRRLRDFTRKGEHPQEPVDVNRAVRETIALLMLDSRQHQVSILTDLTDKSVMIQGDAIGLQQVFVNLILNACESLVRTELEHRIVTLKTEQSGPFVDIEVVDNGPGFGNRDFDQVFDTFYSTKTRGMGMGLAISRTLVEAHGGTLTASNAEDGGAVLHIALPRLEGATQPEVVSNHV